jgi:hypothetical protein
VFFLAITGGAAGAAEAPEGARRAAGEYLNYAIAMDQREPGFLLINFGAEEPTVASVGLGEPYEIFQLTKDGLRSFAASKGADLLEFAHSTGFGFPVTSSEGIIGAITCSVASDEVKHSTDSTLVASIEKNDGWMWSGLLKENNRVLEALRGVRKEGGADLAMLSIAGQGSFLLVVAKDGIERIAATSPGSPLFVGVAKEGPPPPYVFTDYATAEPIMRSNAQKERK